MIDTVATDAASALAQLVSGIHASAGETASAALTRWTRVAAAATEVGQRLAAERDEAKKQRATRAQVAEVARGDVGRAEVARQSARKQLDDYLGDLAGVAADEDFAPVADELAGSAIDGVSVAAWPSGPRSGP